MIFLARLITSRYPNLMIFPVSPLDGVKNILRHTHFLKRMVYLCTWKTMHYD